MVSRQVCLLSMISFFAIISGCCTANTNVLNKGKGKMEVIATSNSSDCCLKKAKEVAEEFCTVRKKQLVVTNEQTDYQGADKSVKAAIGVIGALTGTHASGNTSEDYRTKLSFECEES